jgi:hypothetical protein
MVANAVLFTIAILLAYGFWLLDQLKFMARYKAAVFHVSRRFLLKNTGRKLSHLDKQFHVGQVDMPLPAGDEEPN